eukprot:2192015-Rhodomonas_salina.1
MGRRGKALWGYCRCGRDVVCVWERRGGASGGRFKVGEACTTVGEAKYAREARQGRGLVEQRGSEGRRD